MLLLPAYLALAIGCGAPVAAPDSVLGGTAPRASATLPSIRIVLFGDSNTDTCIGTKGMKSSYVSVRPALSPTSAHLACQVAGKVEAKWGALRTETMRAVNHGVASTATGGGGYGWQDRTTQGSPNARTKVDGWTRYEAEVLGRGYPWSGGEPVNKHFPHGAVRRVNAYTPRASDFVYVSMGTNDAAALRNMTPSQTESSLRWMINRWLAAGKRADHFILTTLAPSRGASSATAIPQRNTRIRKLAVEIGVHLIDLAAYTSNDNGATWRSASLHVGDGIHYTDAVRDWIAGEIVARMSAITPAP